jgi:hypothetical protein
MMTNATGPASIIINRERDYEIFDTLPAVVREAMNDSWFAYSSAEVAARLRKHSATRVALDLAQSDVVLAQGVYHGR